MALPSFSGRNQILLGRDGRLSSPEIKQYLLSGLVASGCHVIDLGLTPTPVVYFALEQLNIPDAVIVTASHNPGHYNGIKMVVNNRPLSKDEIRQIYDLSAKAVTLRSELKGSSTDYDDILTDYTAAIVKDVKLRKATTYCN